MTGNNKKQARRPVLLAIPLGAIALGIAALVAPTPGAEAGANSIVVHKSGTNVVVTSKANTNTNAKINMTVNKTKNSSTTVVVVSNTSTNKSTTNNVTVNKTKNTSVNQKTNVNGKSQK